MKTKIISVCSTKGGVGKTTTVGNIGGYLHDMGYRVLLIDADIQPTLSSLFEITKKSDYGLVEFIKNLNSNCISNTKLGFDIIYSNDADGDIQYWLSSQPDGIFKIKQAIESLDVTYDYIIIDCQGARSPLSNASLMAANVYFSPIIPDALTAKEFFRGTLDAVQKINNLKKQCHLDESNLIAFFNQTDKTVDSLELQREIKKIIDDNKERFSFLKILSVNIPKRVIFKVAAKNQLPVHKIKEKKTSAVSTSYLIKRLLENSGLLKEIP